MRNDEESKNQGWGDFATLKPFSLLASTSSTLTEERRGAQHHGKDARLGLEGARVADHGEGRVHIAVGRRNRVPGGV